MVRSEYDFNKIVKALEGIKSRLDRNSGVKAELIYKAKDLDKVLSAGTIEQDTSIISIPGDKHVNERFGKTQSIKRRNHIYSYSQRTHF